MLDPVGCGATPYRTAAAAELAALRPTVIRANASEIMSLAGATGAGTEGRRFRPRGPTTRSTPRARSRARTGSVVAVTGAVDYATDGASDRRASKAAMP